MTRTVETEPNRLQREGGALGTLAPAILVRALGRLKAETNGHSAGHTDHADYSAHHEFTQGA